VTGTYSNQLNYRTVCSSLFWDCKDINIFLFPTQTENIFLKVLVQMIGINLKGQ